MADNKEVIMCPACGKEMVKIFVKSANRNVDVCLNGCGGLYFDNKEFFLFDEKHESISEIIDALKDKNIEEADLEKERYCPCCGSKMVKNFTSFSKEIAVDDCYNCGGKFLDYGELEKIRNQYENSQEKTDAIREKILSTVEYNELSSLNPKGNYKKSPLKENFDNALDKTLTFFERLIGKIW